MKKLLLALIIAISAGTSFAWDCPPSASYRWEINGDRYALCMSTDGADMMNLIIATNSGGGWSGIGIVDDDVTNEKIMSYGSIYNYFASKLPKANAIIQSRIYGQKPSLSDKVGGVIYDLPKDFVFDPAAGVLRFNKQPPLSHAR
jgi:hypothetical protein